RPRRPSLAPSSITTMSGRARASSCAKRLRPPAVVSPEMLALWKAYFVDFASASATQPCSGRSPWAADSESPITSTFSSRANASGAASIASMTNAPTAQPRNTGPIASAPSHSVEADDASTPGRGSLRTRGVGKTVALPDSQLTILDDISLDIAAGERVAIVGESGSGKTTLLSLLAWLEGQPIPAADEDARAALRAEAVGFVFQNFQLMPAMSALDNVALPLELRGRRGGEAARDLLERVGLGRRLGHLPRQLSGGEQQRVAIARAFVAQPRILFADEPTGNLDRKTGLAIEDLLFDMDAGRRTTVVIVTHDERLAARCDRQLRLDAGRLLP